MTTTERLHYEGKALHHTSLIHDEIKDLPWDERRYIIAALFYFLSEELRNTFIEEENKRRGKMKIYIGSEESHGDLYYSNNPQKIKEAFIKKNWICGNTVIDWDFVSKKYFTVQEKLGEDWEKRILAFTLDEFNDYFIDMFRIREVEPI